MIAAVLGSWALFLGLGLLMVGNGLQGTLLGVRASLEGFTTTVTGILMSGYFAGFLVGSLVTPKMLARVGHVRVFAALASLASTAILIQAVFVDPVIWTAMRLLSGCCYAGLFVVAESWLNEAATNETRGQLLSIYMVVMLGGMALGQMLLNLADPQAVSLFVLVSVLVSLALIPMLLSVGRVPAFQVPTPVGLADLYRASPAGVVGMFGAGAIQGAIFGMGAVYGRQIGLSVGEISLFMSAILLGGVVLQWPVGRSSDAFDRRLVMSIVTLLGGGLALAAGAAAGQSATLFLALAWLFGGATLPMYSLCLAHTNDYLAPEQMTDASGTLVLIAGLGAIVGPVSVAGAMSLFGPDAFFWWLAILHGAMGLFLLYRMTRRPAVPLADQGAYVAMPPRATAMASTLYAEAAEEAAVETPADDAGPAADAVRPDARSPVG